jgi:hypothetical protein
VLKKVPQASSVAIAEDVKSDIAPRETNGNTVTVIEPVAVSDEPVAVSDEPVAVSDEPVAVSDEPVAVSDEPVAVSDEPVAGDG